MIVNSKIQNLYKAIDWIKKQSLGLRHEAIAWTKGNQLEAIDWRLRQSIGTKSNRLGIKQLIGTPLPSLKHAVTG